MKALFYLVSFAVGISCKAFAQGSYTNIADYFNSGRESINYIDCSGKSTKKKAASCRSFKKYVRLNSGYLEVRTEERISSDTGYYKIETSRVQLKNINFSSAQIVEVTCTNSDQSKSKYFSLGFSTISSMSTVKRHFDSSEFGVKDDDFFLISFLLPTREDANHALNYLQDKLNEDKRPQFVLPLSIFQGDDKKYGLKDAKGVVVVEAKYDQLFRNNLGFYVVQSEKKRGMLGKG